LSVDVEVDESGVALITMNRPERMNAMDAEAYEQLSAAWSRVRDDADIRVAIITGAGDRAFSTGADLKSFVGSPADISQFWLTQQNQLLNRGLEVWKPVVAAVNGYCIGGGMTLLLATDIRIATPTATFGLSEVKRGVLAGNGGTQRILEQLPHAVAMEMLLTAFEVAHEICGNAPLAVQATKEVALRSRDVDRATGLRMETAMNRLLMFTEDAKEGPAAFAERRTPNFAGR
jgi:E-phenylitaconyl-CoA hydratase